MNKETEKQINGLHLYLQPDETMHQFALVLYIKAGSMYESRRENGITHLFEHMVFRSIKNKYSGKLYTLLSDNGIYFNASTYKDLLTFNIWGLKRGLRLGTDILMSVFDELRIEKQEFNAEKQRVLSEIREDDERHSMSWFSNSFVWKGTSLQQSISGGISNVRSCSFAKLCRFRKSILTPDNLFFCGTGNVGDEDIEYILRGMEKLRLGESAPLRSNCAPVPDDFFRRNYSLRVQNKNYYSVGFSFDIDNKKCPASVRDILYHTLLTNDDSELYTALSEDTGLIYSFNDTLEEYSNISCLKFKYEIAAEDIPKAIEATVEVLQKLKRGEFDFERNLQKSLDLAEMLLDDASELNWVLAYNNHVVKDGIYDYSRKDLGRFCGLNKEHIVEAARIIFRPENLVLTFQGDRRRISRFDIKSITDRLASDR